MSEKWPLDWNNDDDYRYLTNIKSPDEQLAWEFLRRNPKYVEDFEKNKNFIKDNKFFYYIENLFKTSCGTQFCMKVDMRHWYGLAHHSENYDPKIKTPPNFDKNSAYPLLNIPSELELIHSVDLSNENELSLCRSQTPDKKVLFFDFLDFPEGRPNPNEFIAHVPINCDWKEQAKVLKKFHDKHKPEKHDPKTYIRCLRILDALAVNVPKPALFILFNDSKRNKNDYKTENSTLDTYIRLAYRYRDYGYVYLARTSINHQRPEWLDDLICPEL